MGLTTVPGPPRVVQPVLRAVWPALAVAVTACATPVLVVGAFHSLVDRRARLFRITALTVLLIWVDLGLLRSCRQIEKDVPDRTSEEWRTRHEELLRSTLDTALHLAKRWTGFEVRLADRMHVGNPDAPLIAFARHAGIGDSLALAWLFARTADRVPRIVLADALRWDPGIALILTRLGSYFVPTDRSRPRVQGIADLAQSLRPNEVLLLFPEGQNWSASRQLRIVERLRALGRDREAFQAAALSHVLPPKTRGVVAALDARPDADVMVVGHTGTERILSLPALWDAVPFTGRPMLVRTDTHDADEIPDDPEGVVAWVEEHWTDLDEWVAEHSPDPDIRAESGWVRLDDD